MLDRPLWQEAASFSARAHCGQQRRDKRTPYAAHPMRVALTVVCRFECTDEAVIAAALLHDVLEDTATDYDELHERFGAEVADLVACLSKDDRLPEAQREAQYHRQLAEGPWKARLIKLADVYDNLAEASQAGLRRRLRKARRALELGAGDERLARAHQALSELIDLVERSLPPTPAGANA